MTYIPLHLRNRIVFLSKIRVFDDMFMQRPKPVRQSDGDLILDLNQYYFWFDTRDHEWDVLPPLEAVDQPYPDDV